MPPQKDESPSCFVMLLALCFVVFLFFAVAGNFVHGVALAAFTFFVLGLPIGVVKLFAELGRKSALAPRPPPRAAPIREPRKADQLAEARSRYEAALAMIDATGLNPAEARAAKEKARRQLMKTLDGLL